MSKHKYKCTWILKFRMLPMYLLVATLVVGWLVLKLLKGDGMHTMPGPPRLPLLGNFHQLKPNTIHLQMLEWAQKYGPVFKVVLAGHPVVVVTGTKAMMEVT